jgi:VCBS repeat-containing protein
LGLVTDNGDGTFDYDPNGQFESLGVGATATDTFDYTVSDGNGGSDTATVTVTITGVNDAPVAMGDLLTVSEDTAGSVLVTLNDGDIDGDDVEVSSLDDTATLGTVAIGADADTVNYDPNGMFESLGAGETATDTFDYTVSDGNGGTDTATVTVTITGVNDAPVFGAVGPFAVDENTTAVGTVTASDVEGDVVSFSITGGDDGGLFDIDTTTGALSFKTAPDFEAPLDTGADNSYEIQVTVSDGTDTVDTFIFVDVRDVDEGGGVNVIQGTADPFDPLVGTEGRDEIRTGGGPFDDLTGGGGADTFVIEQTVGTRDLINILDYEVGTDVIDLQDRSVVFSNAFNSATYLFLDGDFDTIIVNGANSFADITFA